jgi:membrane protein implicated in regulation of membrane protease activity
LFPVDWWLVGVIAVIVIAVVVLIVFRTINTYHSQVTTGKEDLIGKSAIVKEKLDPEGTVTYKGDLWTAVSKSGSIESGEEVVISKVEGLKLIVTKKA